MPAVVIAVVAATALLLVVILLGPSRRIRREARLGDAEYYAVMAGEGPAASSDETGLPDDDEAGPALGDERIP